jgi:ABC-type Fe3+-hydroxamate transport system substrate-binding protein
MKDELFKELLKSLREGGKILKGKLQASRRFEFSETQVRQLRKKNGAFPRRIRVLNGH